MASNHKIPQLHQLTSDTVAHGSTPKLEHPPPLSVLELEANSKNNNANNNRVELDDNNTNNSEGLGLFLTWEDLWVSVAAHGGKVGSTSNSSRAILKGVTGYAEPGKALAIMGPSGCGKSTLLDALAGRLEYSMRRSGDVLINGHKQELAYGTSAYVTQDDTLISTLTVKEAVYFSAQLQLPDKMSGAEKKQMADTTINEMGLQDAMNTRIGGWGAKGLSGGQKRRVSICIEILTRPKLLFLDEPTSGLDSASSYYVMSRIISHRQRDQRTIIASIHQPSSEVFQLFENLCLLSSGRTVYFGPASAAIEFFSSSGFPCPSLQNPSDHFLHTINKDFDEDVEAGMSGRKPTEEAIDILVQSYKSSNNFQQVQTQVAKICKMDSEQLEKSSHSSFGTQCLVLTRRSCLNMIRDLGYYWLRLAVYLIIAIGLGTMFYDVGSGHNSIQARGSMLMFVASFLTFMAIGGFPSFVEEMKVFYRERLNGHYSSSAFVIGNSISSLPFLLLISIIPGVLAYYLAGLRKGYDYFAYYALVLFTSTMLVESLMMIVASIVPSFLMGIITGAGIQGLMILCGGFFRLPNDLPKLVWKYPLYYVSFHRYAYHGLFKNEFVGRTFAGSSQVGRPPLDGEQILRENWQVELGYSKWVDLGILLGMVVIYRGLFLIIVKTKEKVVPQLKKPFGCRVSKPTNQFKVDPQLHQISQK